MSERKIKLQIKDMTKKYDNGDGVEHINLDIYEGEIVTFLGPSGCGKTTILRTIGGFLDATSGDITIDGQSIIGLPPEKRPTAMVFQSYNLSPHMTIYENLAFGLKLRKVPKAEINADIKKILALVSMSVRFPRFRAVSNSVSPSRAACSSSPPCCYSTSRSPRSMQKSVSRCARS